MVLIQYRKMDTLALKNVHVRDAAISFYEPDHKYTIAKDKRPYTSVTTFNTSLFRKFNAPVVAAKLVENTSRMNDPNYKYYQMSATDIEQMWDANGTEASSRGTSMHLDIERFFNGVPVTNNSKEFQFFHDFWRDYGCDLASVLDETLSPDLSKTGKIETLIPYRTEWCVYYEEYQLAGSIDMIFENPDGTLQIYDWKRCKEISPEHDDKRYPKFSIIPGLGRLPDTHYWKYALQLNMYKRILETKYGKTVTGLFLICLHPDHDGYQRIELPVLTKTINSVLIYRKKQLRKSKTPPQTQTNAKCVDRDTDETAGVCLIPEDVIPVKVPVSKKTGTLFKKSKSEGICLL